MGGLEEAYPQLLDGAIQQLVIVVMEVGHHISTEQGQSVRVDKACQGVGVASGYVGT